MGPGRTTRPAADWLSRGGADCPPSARRRNPTHAAYRAGQPVTTPAYYPAMSRRAAPARIDEARRAATWNRLIGSGLDETAADAWLAAWANVAAQDGLERGAAYWALPGGGSRPSARGARP